MIDSNIEYLEKVGNLLSLEFDDNTDYVVKGSFPIDYNTMQGLLDIELQDITLLENVYLEFDSLNLSGRQILNLCNNLNTNILIKSLTPNQLQATLKNYTIMDMRKTVYPTKIIVLLTLYLLYIKHFIQEDVLDNIEKNISEIYNKFIEFTYLKDQYVPEYIIDGVKYYLDYLAETEPEFIQNFKQHCLYLFNTAYSYYKKVDQETGDLNSKIRSGLAVPLAYVMVDLRFNIFKTDFSTLPPPNYNYLSNLFKGDIIRALAPLIDHTILVENYISETVREAHTIQSSEDLTQELIINLLTAKKSLHVPKDFKTNLDLFPLEIIVDA